MSWHYTWTQEGALYTRHAPPEGWNERSRTISTREVMGLPEHLTRQVWAVHEAGHAVIGLLVGLPIVKTEVRSQGASEGYTRIEGCYRVSWLEFAAFLAAGERAVDGWLHRTGLWTPARAWCSEFYARLDRLDLERQARAQQVGFEVGYGQRDAYTWDYAVACDYVDALLVTQWPRVQALATFLDTHGTADAAIGRVTGLHVCVEQGLEVAR